MLASASPEGLSRSASGVIFESSLYLEHEKYCHKQLHSYRRAFRVTQAILPPRSQR